MRAQDTTEVASLTFDEICYSGHPYSRPEDGYPETIRSITRDDLVSFHAKHFGPQGMVISIVGGVDPERALDSVIRFLGDWENPDQPVPPNLPPFAPLMAMITHQVNNPGKSEADIIMGVAGPSRRSPGYLAASLGNNILGQFGMMGRIGESVRERSGLAYNASSSLRGGFVPGPGL